MPSRGKARLWPAFFIMGGVALALGATWLGAADSSEEIRQDRVVRSLVALVAGAVSLLAWVVSFSRLPARTRVWAVCGFLAVVGGFLGSFRYRGVSGDVVPQFEPRFRSGSLDLGEAGGSRLPGAADFPQFLGPSRNGTVAGGTLTVGETELPAPRLLWRRPVGRGWSSFAVAGEHAVTQEQHSAEERVVSYELATGRVHWASRETARYENALAGEGPRATPSIADGRVYAMGASGLLTALDLATGELLWKRDVLRDASATRQTWGKADSPLVLSDRVIVQGGEGRGASLVAYDRVEGKPLWTAGTDGAGYASPALMRLAGVEQVVSFNHSSVSGHDPHDGELLWRYPWPGRQPNVAQPLELPGDRVLFSSGYGVGSKLVSITARPDGTLAADLVWESLRLKSKFANVVFHDGYIYGLDDGILVCLDPDNGRRCWKRGRYGHGQLLLVDGVLLVQTEHGDVVLVDPGPEELVELARFPVLEGKIWNPPALAGRYLLIRNDAEAMLYELDFVVPAGSP